MRHPKIGGVSSCRVAVFVCRLRGFLHFRQVVFFSSCDRSPSYCWGRPTEWEKMRHPNNGDVPFCAASQFWSVAFVDFCVLGRSFSSVVARSCRYIVRGAVASGENMAFFTIPFLRLAGFFSAFFADDKTNVPVSLDAPISVDQLDGTFSKSPKSANKRPPPRVKNCAIFARRPHKRDDCSFRIILRCVAFLLFRTSARRRAVLPVAS